MFEQDSHEYGLFGRVSSQTRILALVLLIPFSFYFLWEFEYIKVIYGNIQFESVSNQEIQITRTFVENGKIKEKRKSNSVKRSKNQSTDHSSYGFKLGNPLFPDSDIGDRVREKVAVKYTTAVDPKNINCSTFLWIPLYKFGKCTFEVDIKTSEPERFSGKSTTTGSVEFTAKGLSNQRTTERQIVDRLVTLVSDSVKEYDKTAEVDK